MGLKNLGKKLGGGVVKGAKLGTKIVAEMTPGGDLAIGAAKGLIELDEHKVPVHGKDRWRIQDARHEMMKKKIEKLQTSIDTLTKDMDRLDRIETRLLEISEYLTDFGFAKQFCKLGRKIKAIEEREKALENKEDDDEDTDDDLKYGEYESESHRLAHNRKFNNKPWNLEETRNRTVNRIKKYEGFCANSYYDVVRSKSGRTCTVVLKQDDKGVRSYWKGKLVGRILSPDENEPMTRLKHKLGITVDDPDFTQFFSKDGTLWNATGATLTRGYGEVVREDDPDRWNTVRDTEAHEKIYGFLKEHDTDLRETLEKTKKIIPLARELYEPLADFFYNVSFGAFTRKQSYSFWSKAQKGPSWSLIEQAKTEALKDVDIETLDNPSKDDLPKGHPNRHSYQAFSIKDFLLTGDVIEVCNIMSWFRKSSGHVLPGLEKRRRDEIKTILDLSKRK